MRTIWAVTIAMAGAIGAPAAARADMAECRAKINGAEATLSYDRDADVYASFREHRLNWRGTCPGAVVIAHMMPELSAAERAPFCAVYDSRADEYRAVAEGARDAYGRCARPSRACRIVNATKREALEIGALGVGVATAGVTAARDRAGVLVLTGQAGAVAGALETAGGSVVTALSAPGILAGAAVSVVAVGGAVYLCR
jgi:hypothetical protein